MMHDHDIHHPSVMDGGDIIQKDINDPLEKMLLKMEHEHIGADIISKHEKLVGVFTYIDACRCFGEYIKLNSPVKQVTISLKKH